MITPKKLLKLARKWQKQATLSRKRGHFVVYSADQRRFVILIVYLQNKIFRELLSTAYHH
ncbi:hypothetical protein DCAR_0833063 [Daucus carota subsp. sativus]|uniref:Uncharacterized protein n=1 Tax=Daucus carota subsp. sativus TaxID=79200 RepID=A0AAF1BD52_DAUCS|nr:hypothetical protein DCAR_0833063 [Daucus carota subsp. sativus]